MTALHWAAKNGHAEIIKLRLRAGTNPNACREGLETPLFYAARFGSSQCMELLLNAGARPDHRDPDGETVIEVARKNKELHSA